jgi:hypothetical protein
MAKSIQFSMEDPAIPKTSYMESAASCAKNDTLVKME